MAQQTQDVNAVEMLKTDHQQVAQLFDHYERAEAAEREAIATQIFNALDIHTILEEEIFYPAVREQIDFNEVIDEEELTVGETSTEETVVVEDADDSDDIIGVSYEENQMIKDLIKQ